jgi:hypothetical protein
MKPLLHSAFEGRANPKGIPCLYVATTKTAAMAEVRPWIGAMVSLATFKIISTITIVDCSTLHAQYWKLLQQQKSGEDIPPEKFDDIVWAAIHGAFAEPVTRADDTADYAPTQILAELFRAEGYNGVANKSVFGEIGHNIALFDLNAAVQIDGVLFDLNAAVQIDGVLYETTGIDFKFEESG